MMNHRPLLHRLVGALCLAGATVPAGCRCQGQPQDRPLPVQAPTGAGASPARGTTTSAAPTGVTAEALATAKAKLVPLHETIRKPGPGDWLTEHAEPGQTFAQYLTEDPVTPDLEPDQGKRNKLYIQPLGPLTATERKMVKLTAEYMEAFFGLPVVVKDDLPLSIIPSRARRTHPSWGVKQILSGHVLDEVLAPRLPADAAAYICFTASDLWPGKGWNFVFGEASLRDRVGVWSMHRNGDPDQSPASFQLALLRTIKTAVHETGHMFSMRHCTAYECVMCGANNRAESDRRPVWLCPECVAKIAWATRTPLATRYERLSQRAGSQGFEAEANHFRRSIRALRD